MKKSKRIAFITAGAMIAAGLIIVFGGMIAMRFDFKKLNTVDFVTHTYPINENFSNISITGADCNVSVYSSDDSTCRVVCGESDKISHSVTVNADTLIIERHDNRKWYEHIGFYWNTMDVALYLPQAEYNALYIKTVSGDITVSDAFSFKSAEIQSTSGDITFNASADNFLTLKTVSGEQYIGSTASRELTVISTSGNITVKNIKVAGEIEIKTVSGNMSFSGVACQNLTANTTSGESNFSDTIAKEKVHVKSISGDIELHRCDAASLWLQSVSGDVFGSLLTPKIFLSHTTSGSIHVPGSASGGQCEITTTSGNIEFVIQEH